MTAPVISARSSIGINAPSLVSTSAELPQRRIANWTVDSGGIASNWITSHGCTCSLRRIATIFMEVLADCVSMICGCCSGCLSRLCCTLSREDVSEVQRGVARSLSQSSSDLHLEVMAFERSSFSAPLLIPNHQQSRAFYALERRLNAMERRIRTCNIEMRWTSRDVCQMLLRIDSGTGGAIEAIDIFIRRLKEIPSAQDNWQGILYRLNEILESCLSNPEFFRVAILCADEMGSDCEDRVETFFSKLNLQWELHCNPQMQQPQALKDLLIGIERMHLIEKWVLEHTQGRDELEIYLYCLVCLRQELMLPCAPQQMEHLRCGQISSGE